MAGEHSGELGGAGEGIGRPRSWLTVLPSAGAYHLHSGTCRAGRGECDRAIEAFNEAVRLEPRSTYHLRCRSGVLYEMGEMDRWDADLEMILRIDTENEGGDVNAVLEQRIALPCSRARLRPVLLYRLQLGSW